MKILIICHTAALAGAEQAIAESMQALQILGHQVFVVVPEGGPFLELVAPYIEGHTIIRFDHWCGTTPLSAIQKVRFMRGYYRSARRILRYAKQVGADMLLTNTAVVCVGALAAWLGSLPHVWYVQEFVTEDHGLVWWYGQERSYQYMAATSRVVLANSRIMADKLARFMPQRKIRQLYYANLVPWQGQARPVPLGPRRLLMAGAISEGKNQLLAVEALAILLAKGQAYELHLVGKAVSAYKTKLDARAAELGIELYIFYHPFAPREQVFGLGDCLLMCSRAEAFGRVTVEAQKSGLPVIGSRSGAVPELINNGETGLTFEVNAPDALAEAIQRLFNQAGLYEYISQKALTYANDFYSLASHTRQLSDALSLMIPGAPDTARPEALQTPFAQA